MGYDPLHVNGEEARMRLRHLTWYEEIAVVFVGIAVGATFSAYVLEWPQWLANISGQTWAAWLQAFGAIAALWAGFALARRQYAVGLRLQKAQARQEQARQLKVEREEESRVLQAIRDELEISLEHFESVLGRQLDDCLARGKDIFAMYSLMPSDPFPVYRSLVGRLPILRDQDLRQRIVRTYAQMGGLLLTVQTNSELARSYLASTAQAEFASYMPGSNSTAPSSSNLRSYFPTLVQTRADVVAQVRALVTSIDFAKGDVCKR